MNGLVLRVLPQLLAYLNPWLYLVDYGIKTTYSFTSFHCVYRNSSIWEMLTHNKILDVHFLAINFSLNFLTFIIYTYRWSLCCCCRRSCIHWLQLRHDFSKMCLSKSKTYERTFLHSKSLTNLPRLEVKSDYAIEFLPQFVHKITICDKKWNELWKIDNFVIEASLPTWWTQSWIPKQGSLLWRSPTYWWWVHFLNKTTILWIHV